MADILQLSDAAAIRRAHEAASAEPDNAYWVVLQPFLAGMSVVGVTRFVVVEQFPGDESGHYYACQHAAWLSGDRPEHGPFLVRRYVLDRQ